MTVRAGEFHTAAEIAGAVSAGVRSATDVATETFDRIRAVDPALNAFVTLLPDIAMAQAERVDGLVRAGADPGPLAGVPVAIKDLADIAGVPTTSGSHPDFHRIPQASAPVVQRLIDAGAVIVGKTNLHEFAYGVTNINPHTGAVHNPWDLSRIPGGSSGGSAAAVGARLVPAAMGTDTGGSIRIPASLCGIVGLKPTYGVVPVAGITPLSWTLDHAGPMTATVADAARLFAVMAGRQPMPAGAPDLRGLRIGVPRRFFWEDLDGEVTALAEGSLRVFRDQGAAVSEIDIPLASLARSAVALIINVEAAAIHQTRLRRRRMAFGDDVRVRLERGFFVPAADYLLALDAQTYLTASFGQVFESVDVLVTPTTVAPAAPIEEDEGGEAEFSLAMSLELTRCTNAFNLTGMPALSVPCGFTRDGLPVGVQIVGRDNDEATVLRVGEAYQRYTDWHLRRPRESGQERG